MLKYTIAFIKRNDEILLLNRESGTWMGSWNGVGGKIEQGETPEECVLREIKEETGIILNDVVNKGTVTWDVRQKYIGGMYAFLAEIPDTYHYQTPSITREGILDWKKVDWIFHRDNTGVANLNYFLRHMLENNGEFNYHFVYQGNEVISFSTKRLEKVSD